MTKCNLANKKQTPHIEVRYLLIKRSVFLCFVVYKALNLI